MSFKAFPMPHVFFPVFREKCGCNQLATAWMPIIDAWKPTCSSYPLSKQIPHSPELVSVFQTVFETDDTLQNL